MTLQLYVSIYKKGGRRSLRHSDWEFLSTIVAPIEFSQISFLILFTSYTEHTRAEMAMVGNTNMLRITYERQLISFHATCRSQEVVWFGLSSTKILVVFLLTTEKLTGHTCFAFYTKHSRLENSLVTAQSYYNSPVSRCLGRMALAS